MISQKTIARSRVAWRSLPARRCFVFATLTPTLALCAASLSWSQPPLSVAGSDATGAEQRFGTPQATVAQWMRAVNEQTWREEYECYTGAQQAKFTYQVLVSTRELSDAPDLCRELQRILEERRFPANGLDAYPSLRMDLSDLSDEEAIETALQRQDARRQLQLIRWEREMQPLPIDWARLIEQLQPLLVESRDRHVHDLHPSTSGIARHLGFHRFELESDIQVDDGRAEGLILPVLRDENYEIVGESSSHDVPGTTTIAGLLPRIRRALGIERQRVTRDPERIALVRTANGWKIDEVPFR